jgi:PqqD family protein of HPr-rel-A system
VIGLLSWVPRRRPGLAAYPLDDELVLYDPSDGVTYVLNRAAAEIWALCDGTQPVEVIAGRLAAAYALEPGRALADVRDVLAELRRGDLVVAR